jgi:hypothetical protein
MQVHFPVDPLDRNGTATTRQVEATPPQRKIFAPPHHRGQRRIHLVERVAEEKLPEYCQIHAIGGSPGGAQNDFLVCKYSGLLGSCGATFVSVYGQTRPRTVMQ